LRLQLDLSDETKALLLMSLQSRMGEYMLWADAKVWEIVKSLTDEEFSKAVCDRSGSIRERYLHMAQGHSNWYFRWINKESETIELEKLSRDELFSYLISINREIIGLFQRNDIDVAQNPFRSSDISLRLEEMVFNIINHATYHRAQIVTLLRVLGKDVATTDYVSCLLETFDC
jgi:uncharacterized damage-inducible protein DinB